MGSHGGPWEPDKNFSVVTNHHCIRKITSIVGRVSYPAIGMPFSFVGKKSRPTISFTDHNEVIWKSKFFVALHPSCFKLVPTEDRWNQILNKVSPEFR